MDQNNKKELICPYAALHQRNQTPNGEISLFDIWIVLWSQRLFIGAVTIIVVCAVFAVISLTPKKYVAKVEIAPVDSLEISLINELIGKKVGLPSAEDVFFSVYSNLTSVGVQAQFWEERVQGGKLIAVKALKDPDALSQDWFAKNLECKMPRGRNNKIPQATVLLAGHDPEITAALLAEFVSYVNEFSAKSIVDSIKMQLEVQKETLKNDIEIQLDYVRKKKLSKIANINEAIMIAEKLGLYDLPNNFTDAPLFARGVKALQIEREMLAKRETEDEYDKDLFALESQLEHLNKINIADIKITTLQAGRVFDGRNQDQNKLGIITAGFIFGLAVGIFIAFVKNAVQRTRKNNIVK